MSAAQHHADDSGHDSAGPAGWDGPRNANGRPICGARAKSTGELCQRPPQPGRRRCRYHGGAPGSGSPPRNQKARKHGLFARYYTREELTAWAGLPTGDLTAAIRDSWIRLQRLLAAQARQDEARARADADAGDEAALAAALELAEETAVTAAGAGPAPAGGAAPSAPPVEVRRRRTARDYAAELRREKRLLAQLMEAHKRLTGSGASAEEIGETLKRSLEYIRADFADEVPGARDRRLEEEAEAAAAAAAREGAGEGDAAEALDNRGEPGDDGVT